MRLLFRFHLAAMVLSGALLFGSSALAQTGLSICNETAHGQDLSIGYKGDDEEWTSEGWWNVKPGECAKVVSGKLKKRYYYYRAEILGGDSTGEGYFFCTSPKEYTITGDTKCEERGYDREDFREIDTGDTSTGFTFALTEANTDAPVAAGSGQGGSTDRAQTGLRICNETSHAQDISIGYQGDDEVWTSEGWWNVKPGECARVVSGKLKKRYFYYRAEIQGGEFDGEGYLFCTSPKEYTILGDTECEERGYDREDFSVIDTGATAVGFTFTLVGS